MVGSAAGVWYEQERSLAGWARSWGKEGGADGERGRGEEEGGGGTQSKTAASSSDSPDAEPDSDEAEGVVVLASLRKHWRGRQEPHLHPRSSLTSPTACLPARLSLPSFTCAVQHSLVGPATLHALSPSPPPHPLPFLRHRARL